MNKNADRVKHVQLLVKGTNNKNNFDAFQMIYVIAVTY